MSNQLQLVWQIEQDKEDSLARHLQQARSYLTANQEKLYGLQRYRNEYMKNIHEQGTGGVKGQNYQHCQQFINKLEQACQQQHQNVATAKQVVEQRKQVWLEQQKRRKAVEHLIEKQRKAVVLKQQKEEQKLMDEIVLNRLIRERMSA